MFGGPALARGRLRFYRAAMPDAAAGNDIAPGPV